MSRRFLVGFLFFPALLLAHDRPGTHPFPLDLEVEMETTPLSNGDTFEYLYESFGNTKLQILAKVSGEALGKTEATRLEVYSLSAGARAAAVALTPLGQSNGGYLKYELTLEKPGIYRLLPSTKHTSWKVRCLAKCGREEISLNEALKGMNDTELRMVADKIGSMLGTPLPEHPAALEVARELRGRVLTRDPNLGDRFPVLPDFASLDSWRSGLTLMTEGKKPAEVKKLDKNLEWADRVEFYRRAPRPDPEIIDARTPHILYGHFLSATVPDEMVAQNQALAEVMTLLSLKQGYQINFPAGPRATEKVTSLLALVDLLRETGHRIQVRDERSFANFLAFTYHDKYIRWPSWFRTGLYLEKKEELIFPLPHSQFTFQIQGPQINARVNFFLGISGAAFFPHFDELRPQWTGFASGNQLTDAVEKQRPLIREAFRAAEVYLRRNKSEFPRFAAKYPADGYGYLGVCNDATGALERMVFNKSTFYPLLRAPELAELSVGQDGLDAIFEALPNDSLPLGTLKGGPGSREDILGRLHAMVAYPFDPAFRWDPKLFHQLVRTGKHRP